MKARLINNLLLEVSRLKTANRALSVAGSSREMHRRIAFDVGSGMTKVQLADVDSSGAIVRTLLETEIEVLYGGDWKSSKDGCLSKRIMNAGLSAIERLLEKAKAEAGSHQVDVAAVATEVFRKAKNGEEQLARIRAAGIPVQMVSQEMEAELGFSTAISSGRFDAQHVMSWDSGGGSFQITALCSDHDDRRCSCYLGAFGSTVITSYLVQDIRGDVLDMIGFADGSAKVNPVSASEAEAMIEHVMSTTPVVPDWLPEKVADSNTALVGIGGPTSIFAIASQLCGGKCSLTAADIRRAIDASVGVDEGEHRALSAGGVAGTVLPQQQMVVPKLCLMLAVMTKLGFSRVHFQHALGCGPGLLVHPKFWEEF